MNRRKQILVIVLLAQVALAAMIFISRSAPTSAQGTPLLGALKASDVVGLTLQDNSGKSIALAQQNGSWIIPAIDNYPVVADRITGVLAKLLAVKTDALETRTSTAHAQLQVAETAFTTKVDLKLADGTSQTLYLGTAPSGSSSHVRLAGHDEVYLARTFSPTDFNVDATAWIESVYLNLAQSDILTATLKNAAGTFRFVRDAQNQWTLLGLKAGEKINPDSVVTLLAHLTNLAMTTPLGRIAKPEYGMEPPQALLSIDSKTANGVKTTLLTIGAKDPADNSYVIISSDSPYYVRTAQFNVEEFVTKTRDGLLVLPPTPEPTVAPTIGASGTIEPTATAAITATATITK
jgi:hypothetical protein